jgi:steroid delta-isomerase-like uncharacterized protein
MMATTARAFFDSYLDAWNAHDPAAVARCMADDAIYEDVALGRVLHGPSEIARFVEEATRASSDFRFEQVSLFIAGGDYANEWIMSGTNDREVAGVPATGRGFRVRGRRLASSIPAGGFSRIGTTTTSRRCSRSLASSLRLRRSLPRSFGASSRVGELGGGNRASARRLRKAMWKESGVTAGVRLSCRLGVQP